MVTRIGGNAVASSTSVGFIDVAIHVSAVAGNYGLAGVIYNPATQEVPAPTGWTQIGTALVFSTSAHGMLFERTIQAGDAGTNVRFTNSTTQRLGGFVEIYGATSGRNVINSKVASSGTDHTSPTATTAALGIELSLWGERSTTPSATITVPTGFSAGAQAFATGSGACSVAVAYNLTNIASATSIGGDVWTPSVNNTAQFFWVIGLTDAAGTTATAVVDFTAITPTPVALDVGSASGAVTVAIDPTTWPIAPQAPVIIPEAGAAVPVTVLVPTPVDAVVIGIIGATPDPAVVDITCLAPNVQVDSTFTNDTYELFPLPVEPDVTGAVLVAVTQGLVTPTPVVPAVVTEVAVPATAAPPTLALSVDTQTTDANSRVTVSLTDYSLLPLVVLPDVTALQIVNVAPPVCVVPIVVFSVKAGEFRDITILGTTVPVLGWTTTDPISGWAYGINTNAWATTDPVSIWATSEPTH